MNGNDVLAKRNETNKHETIFDVLKRNVAKLKRINTSEKRIRNDLRSKRNETETALTDFSFLNYANYAGQTTICG